MMGHLLPSIFDHKDNFLKVFSNLIQFFGPFHIVFKYLMLFFQLMNHFFTILVLFGALEFLQNLLTELDQPLVDSVLANGEPG